MPVVFPSGLPSTVRTAHVVAVIPARYQSNRLPGKPLADIHGHSMIELVHERARRARSVDAVVVATDDQRIADAVDGFGGTAVMTATTHESGTDRLAEVAAHLEAEWVVNVQGDEPLMTPQAIDSAVAWLAGQPAAAVSTLRRQMTDPAEHENPAVVKVVVDRDGYALYFSRAPIPFIRAGQPSGQLWKHLGLYVYRRAFLLEIAGLPRTALDQAEGLEQLRVLEHGYRIGTVETTADTIGVDTPEDLERVRRLLDAGVRT